MRLAEDFAAIHKLMRTLDDDLDPRSIRNVFGQLAYSGRDCGIDIMEIRPSAMNLIHATDLPDSMTWSAVTDLFAGQRFLVVESRRDSDPLFDDVSGVIVFAAWCERLNPTLHFIVRRSDDSGFLSYRMIDANGYALPDDARPDEKRLLPLAFDFVFTLLALTKAENTPLAGTDAMKSRVGAKKRRDLPRGSTCRRYVYLDDKVTQLSRATQVHGNGGERTGPCS